MQCNAKGEKSNKVRHFEKYKIILCLKNCNQAWPKNALKCPRLQIFVELVRSTNAKHCASEGYFGPEKKCIFYFVSEAQKFENYFFFFSDDSSQIFRFQ